MAISKWRFAPALRRWRCAWKTIQDSHRFYGIVNVHSDETASHLFLIEGVPSYISPIDLSLDKGKSWKPLKPLERTRSITATADGIELWATGEDDGNVV